MEIQKSKALFCIKVYIEKCALKEKQRFSIDKYKLEVRFSGGELLRDLEKLL
jgi:hypothetical protein